MRTIIICPSPIKLRSLNSNLTLIPIPSSSSFPHSESKESHVQNRLLQNVLSLNRNLNFNLNKYSVKEQNHYIYTHPLKGQFKNVKEIQYLKIIIESDMQIDIHWNSIKFHHTFLHQQETNCKNIFRTLVSWAIQG